MKTKLAVIILFVLLIILGGYFNFLSKNFPNFPGLPWFRQEEQNIIEGIKKFASEEEFKSYFEEGKLGFYSGLGAVPPGMGVEELGIPLTDGKGGGAEPERVSETTVQVPGIDEPDIVKTDGKEIYFSLQGYYWLRFMEWMPPQISGETKIIKAFPPADLTIDSKIEKAGDLLLRGNILVVFSGDEILGYDVSNPKSPQKKWNIELKEGSYVIGARLLEDKIYLVTRMGIDEVHPCPIKPLTSQGVTLTIECTEIYHPIVQIPADVTYNAFKIDINSGNTVKTTSFVGSSDSSVIYMSADSLYVTYLYSGDYIKFYYDFINEKAKDLFPALIIEKIGKLKDYDISDTAKLTELNIILEKYKSSLDNDERLRIDNELSNRMSDYYKEHKRDLEKSGIIKINLSDFGILATGNIPGRPLNQFALDEYQNYLRVATTVGGGFGMFWDWRTTGESANDVYVLDKDLKTVGSIKDMGLTERIYSVRFIEDKGYVVTFRETDPFFVLDLSKPENPELKGELKIPGFSSYLHPIAKDKILGVGREGSQVKLSLFDVSNPEKPSEMAKYILDEYWSDVLETHHAFLQDKKHEIFFMPGSKGGYIFSYKGNSLEMKKAVSDIVAKRAVYINDYLYIIGEDKSVVLNETDWTKVNELKY